MPRPGKQKSHSSHWVLGPFQFSRVRGHPHGDLAPHVDLMQDCLTFDPLVFYNFIKILETINQPQNFKISVTVTHSVVTNPTFIYLFFSLLLFPFSCFYVIYNVDYV